MSAEFVKTPEGTFRVLERRPAYNGHKLTATLLTIDRPHEDGRLAFSWVREENTKPGKRKDWLKGQQLDLFGKSPGLSFEEWRSQS